VKKLSGLDASFLHMETATMYGHVASLVVVDPKTSRSGDVYGDLRRTFEERLHILPVYRRRLVGDALGLDHPYWVDDANLDLDFHVREIALPAPGDEHQLGEQVARIMARPLDRSRPLWECYVISRLADGTVAILNKLHHSTIDGVSGAELLYVLLDTDPGAVGVEPPAEPWEPEREPTSLELLARAVLGYATRPREGLRLQLRLLRMLADLSGNPAVRQVAMTAIPGIRRFARLNRAEAADPPALPNRPAPRTPWNQSVTPHRRFAMQTLRLSDAQTVKRAFDITVNDVVLALCATALRRYLADHGGIPEAPLLVMVPVSVRAAEEADIYSSRVTGVITSLHTNIADPVERMRAIHNSMAAAKEVQRAIPADMLTDITHFAPPTLFTQAVRLATRVRIVDRLSPPFNLTISNVPGPRQPLYLGGALMKHFYPVSIVAEGQGLNITVQSYLDNLDFGLIACRGLMPDLWNLADHLADAMAELLVAAREGGD